MKRSKANTMIGSHADLMESMKMSQVMVTVDSDGEEKEKEDLRRAFQKTYEIMNNEKVVVEEYDEEEEPLERSELPASKDPNMKISPLTILKDNIGKDLSKISMPVFFNEPMNTLQKCAFAVQELSLIHI